MSELNTPLTSEQHSVIISNTVEAIENGVTSLYHQIIRNRLTKSELNAQELALAEPAPYAFKLWQSHDGYSVDMLKVSLKTGDEIPLSLVEMGRVQESNGEGAVANGDFVIEDLHFALGCIRRQTEVGFSIDSNQG